MAQPPLFYFFRSTLFIELIQAPHRPRLGGAEYRDLFLLFSFLFLIWQQQTGEFMRRFTAFSREKI
jgi:hypothetical protein